MGRLVTRSEHGRRGPRAPRGPHARAPRAPGPALRDTLREVLQLLALIAVIGLIGWGAFRAAESGANAAKAGITDLLTPDPVTLPVPESGTRKLKKPMLINIAVDESGSMQESDPENRRWTDVETLGQWLARYQRPDDRVAVTRFTEKAVSGAVVSTRSLTHGARLLADDPSGGGTAFMPVVEQARTIFPNEPDAYRVLILLTDGDSTDSRQAIARLPHVADRVFVVALDKGEHWDSARKAWENAGFPVTKLGNRRPKEIGRAMAESIMAVTGEKER